MRLEPIIQIVLAAFPYQAESDQNMLYFGGPAMPRRRAANPAALIVPRTALDDEARRALQGGRPFKHLAGAVEQADSPAPPGNAPTGTVSNGPLSALFSLFGSNASPQGK